MQLIIEICHNPLCPGGQDGVLASICAGRISPEPYQFAPATKLLSLPRPCILIADDVGLGKTIEAGICMQELIARGRGERILLVVPPGLISQWQDEMLEKFGLEFHAIENAAALDRAQTLLAEGIKPWSFLTRVITSVEYLKKREVMSSALELPWDVVVVDEAHYRSLTRFGDLLPRGRGCLRASSRPVRRESPGGGCSDRPGELRPVRRDASRGLRLRVHRPAGQPFCRAFLYVHLPEHLGAEQGFPCDPPGRDPPPRSERGADPAVPRLSPAAERVPVGIAVPRSVSRPSARRRAVRRPRGDAYGHPLEAPPARRASLGQRRGDRPARQRRSDPCLVRTSGFVGEAPDAAFIPLRYDHERLADEMRAEGIAEPFVKTVETGWWTTCLEILPAKERARGKY